jgi:glycine/D-amino acid oxidase-like deaminating enzyme
MQPHIAVIGAGAFGGWTALHLLRRGARVTLVDAWGAGNSRSSSGGETRFLRAAYGPDRTYSQWVARSMELWRENQQSWGVELYRRTGLLWMHTAPDDYLQAALPILAELGFRVDTLDHDEAARRYPQIRLDDVDSIYFEHEAGYLRARLACQTLCQHFQCEGGRFVRVAVRPGPIVSGRMAPLQLNSGETLAADSYVFACGAWLGEMFPDVVGNAIQPTRQEVYFFGPPAGDAGFEPESMPLWLEHGARRFYGFPNLDNRGFKISDDVRGPAADPSAMDRRPSPEGVDAARQYVEHRFPRLRGAPLLEARVCQYENSPDGHLIVDRHPEAPDVWLVGGGSGHGFKFSPALGEHVAGVVLESEPLDSLFGLARLTNRQIRTTQFGGTE